MRLYEIDQMEMWFNFQEDIFKNALIIEWFDSVGIYIDIVIVFKKDTPKYVYYYGRYTNQSQQYNTRQEATKHAIIKANKIYNEQQQGK